MARNFLSTMFGDASRALQETDGSREAYARIEALADGTPDALTEREAEFILARDSFYLASVTAQGWPYIQHRGGPPGFLNVLSGNRLAFADQEGNRQHLTEGNLAGEPRVALFLMDYPNQRRLKLIGRATVHSAADMPELTPPDLGTLAKRIYQIDVVGYDWNCPKFITPRFTQSELDRAVAPLLQELSHLRGEVETLRAQLEDVT